MTNEAEYIAIQNELQKKISLCDSFDVDKLNTVAGVNLAYWQKDNEKYAVCCIVVIDIHTHEIIKKSISAVK